MQTKRLIIAAVVGAVWVGSAIASAEHNPPHDGRPNPNCAWDSSRSADWDGDGEPDHFVFGVSHNTTFPRQLVVLTEPITGMDHIPPFFGGDDGPDNLTVTMQGDHRLLGANPSHDEDGNPEQKHNGAIRAHVDYDDVEHGRTPYAEFGFGIYEANHLVMLCVDSEGEAEAAVCLNGMEFYRMTDEECPQD